MYCDITRKDAHISTIFKKGNKSEPGNYRPVSLTSIVCKLIESIIRDHITTHLVNNDVFSKFQYGFISGRSTSLQLLKALNKWTEIMDRNGTVDTIYFDFQKAFDTVPHNLMLSKLPCYGINPQIINWITNFITGRRQKVIINGSESNWGTVTSGIPQGSILGPLIFALYINDLPDVLDDTTDILLFADDTKIFKEIHNEKDQENLQMSIDNMCKWSQD